MIVLLAQVNPTIGDFAGNAEKILNAIAEGRRLGAHVVLFPELSICGYPPEDLLLLERFIESCEDTLLRIAFETKGIVAIVGTPRREGNELFNSAAILSDGELLGYQDKTLLPTYDVFDEQRYFTPAREVKLWNFHGKKVAITICEDLWQHSAEIGGVHYAHDPVQELKPFAPDLVLNLSASPFSTGKLERRTAVCANAAKFLRCPVLLCNQIGGNDSLIYDGHSLYVNAEGKTCAQAAGFAEDLLPIDLSQKASPVSIQENELDNLYRALVLGVRDYFHKSGFSKACIALSGGIDSALVACIAVEALGAENILGVAMPSRYSSPSSLTDARALAKTLGIPLRELSIEGPFTAYLELLGPVFGDRPADATEENLQARIRGMIMMAISNKLGCIVLSTGNKSELAMGYATLYGDMAGGLSVINDLTKQQVYALARRINRDHEIIPQSTIDKPPSAELRPHQKDSDTLPDYAIVDNVLRDYVEKHQCPEEIAVRYGYNPQLVDMLVKKIHRNEYKRRQSAPGLRVSEKAFSVGRRFPIVQRWEI